MKVMKSGGFLNLIEFSRRETFRGVDHDCFCKLQLATKLKSMELAQALCPFGVWVTNLSMKHGSLFCFVLFCVSC
jgi:hypothetical protein